MTLTTKAERAAKRAARKAEIAEHNAKLDAIRAEVRKVVAGGACPDCGRKLRRNLSLAGWWQCSQLGAVGFRADASLPSCDWQGFTE